MPSFLELYHHCIVTSYKQEMIKLLEAVNRKAFKWCFKIGKYDFLSQLLSEADWHNLKYI